MKNINKRIYSILLALVMIIGMIPMGAMVANAASDTIVGITLNGDGYKESSGGGRYYLNKSDSGNKLITSSGTSVDCTPNLGQFFLDEGRNTELTTDPKLGETYYFCIYVWNFDQAQNITQANSSIDFAGFYGGKVLSAKITSDDTLSIYCSITYGDLTGGVKAIASDVEYDSTWGGYIPTFSTLKCVSTHGKVLDHIEVPSSSGGYYYSYYGASAGGLYKTFENGSFSDKLTTAPEAGETYYSYLSLDSIDGNLNIEEELVDIQIQGYDVEFISAYESDMGFTSKIVYSLTKKHDVVVEIPGNEIAFWSFESAEERAAWTFTDDDGDGYNWELMDDTVNFENCAIGAGKWFMLSNSYRNGVGKLTPDNRAISPKFTVPVNGKTTVDYYVYGTDDEWSDEHYSVIVLDGGNETVLLEETLPKGQDHDNPAHRVLDLSAYAGKTVQLVFRHHNSTDKYTIAIDAITIKNVKTVEIPENGSVLWSFESAEERAAWTFTDDDGDGYNWELIDGTGDFGNCAIGEGKWFMLSRSYYNDYGKLTPDNRAISPAFTVPANGKTTVDYYVFGTDDEWSDEHYSVIVLDGGNETVLLEETLPKGQDMFDPAHRELDLSAYAGKTVQLVFRHHNSTDKYTIVIDAITLTNKSEVGLPGDIDLNGAVDIADAIVLFRYSMMPDLYPIAYGGAVDFTKDGVVDIADAIRLFQYSMLPDLYPLF